MAESIIVEEELTPFEEVEMEYEGEDSLEIEHDDDSYEQDDHDEYLFDFGEDGQVTGLFELEDDGTLEPEHVARSEFSVNEDGSIVEIESFTRGNKQNTYADLDGDGFYTRIESGWIEHPSDLAPGRPDDHRDFGLKGMLQFEGDDDDDALFLADGVGTLGGVGADQFVFRELNHGRVADFNASEGDRLVFDTGYGLRDAEDVGRYLVSLEYDETEQTLEISFGTHGSIEIVGIGADQISWNLVDVLS